MSNVKVHVLSCGSQAPDARLILKLSANNDSVWSGRHRFYHHVPFQIGVHGGKPITFDLGPIGEVMLKRGALMTMVNSTSFNEGDLEVSWHVLGPDGDQGPPLALDIYQLNGIQQQSQVMIIKHDKDDTIHEREIEYVQ